MCDRSHRYSQSPNLLMKVRYNLILLSLVISTRQTASTTSREQSVLCDFVETTSIGSIAGTWNCGGSYLDGCSWPGVTCENDNITAIDFPTASIKGIQGTIPESLGDLQHLRTIDFSSAGFSGSIPSTIGQLSALQTLNLAINYFVGHIPCQIGLLTTLVVLDLSGNFISGSIPTQLLSVL